MKLESLPFDQVAAAVARWSPAPTPSTAVATAPRKRAYAGAAFGRLQSDWTAGSTSADSEILVSLRELRNRSRQLERDNDYAKNAVRLIRNNVVGRGIGMQSQVMMRRGGRLDDVTNDAIETAWRRWCAAKTCSTNGKLSFEAIQRLAVSAIPTSGEILLRIVKRPFGGGKIPLALEVIESDQLVDNYSVGRAGQNGNQIRMGVEMDEWGRPVAYWLYPKHPGDMQFAGLAASSHWQRVPAEEIIHLHLIERPGQTRGVPSFHSAIKRLHNMGGYEEAEIIAARASACIMGFIEGPAETDPGAPEEVTPQGERVTALAPAEIRQLAPGEKFSGFAPTRPNPNMEPFMRFMLRGMCAGVGLSYASLSGDYSQSNYSSSRLALLDDRDTWRVLQDWVVENLCQPVFEAWLEMAVLSGELNLPGYWSAPELYREPRWLTRGWSYVDPLKEVMADKLRVRAGFSTVADVIAAQGGDYEDVFRQRRRELDLADDYDLVLETDPSKTDDKGAARQGPSVPDATDAAAAAAAGDEEQTPGAAADASGVEADDATKSASVLALERAFRLARTPQEREHLLESIEVLRALAE